MKRYKSITILKSVALIAIGLLLGWLMFYPSKHIDGDEANKHVHTEKQKEVWTCSMDPQVRKEAPGKCPICGMDLILLLQHGAVAQDSDAIALSEDALKLAEVATSVVSRIKPIKEVRLYGKVQTDERLLQTQVAHISGRIEKLMINFTGESVKKGQLLAIIYSPDLVTAQQELLEAARSKQQQPEIYEAAKEKLMQWMLTDRQIESIEHSGRIKTNFEVHANTSGIVVAKRVNVGDHVAEGAVLFDVANLSKVWVQFDAYESDLPFIKVGNQISFSLQAVPGKAFTANIQFIDPVIDPVNRVAKVRVEISNRENLFKPEMFATGIIKANLDAYKDNLVIPRSAVLWTGKRSIVYVKLKSDEGALFKMQEIEIGPALGNSYVVISGLEEGEEIVTEGVYNVDASAQLDGKKSMMNH